MPESIANTIFMKILPILLTASIIWMMTSINTMQVQAVRIEEQVNASHKLLTTTSIAIEKLESKAVTQQIAISLLEQQILTLRKDYDRHMQLWHGE